MSPVLFKLIERYPSAPELARARTDSIIKVIRRIGLGRQRSLRLKAMALALSKGGLDVQSLPGLGPYGFGILELSQGREPINPPIDGNVARVVKRLHGMHFEQGEARKKPQVKEAVGDLLEATRGTARKLSVVYALVDLGALVCKPRKPECGLCPLSNLCAYATKEVKQG